MKYRLLLIAIIFFATFNLFSQVHSDQNGWKTSVISSLSANATQAKRFEIASIGYNSYHWQYGGLVVIELFEDYYGTGYEKYVIENGFGQGANSGLPIVKLVESYGVNHSGKLVLGSATDLSTTSGGYVNRQLPILLDIRHYARYKVKFTYLQQKIDVLTGQNQIKINDAPTGVDIPDFTVGMQLNNEIFTSGSLKVSGNGNHYIQNGNVGIGTIAPDEKLTVKGKIHAQEVRVDMAGPLVPDYVFAEDYKLKTLQEVEIYIKENKHLPEIPSAQEIEKNGLMLAEMNMNLLRKMEEMTLYMIEMKKENEKQNEKILILESKLTEQN